MKVYVITKGEYSDYHIVGVSRTMKDAERVKNVFNADNIEVYDTNISYDVDGRIKMLKEQDKEFYRVEYTERPDSANYKKFIAYSIGAGYYDKEDLYNCISGTIRKFENTIHGEKYNYYYFYVVANDKNHAIKIAQDRFAKMKAEELDL